jgi:hypothetical protein
MTTQSLDANNHLPFPLLFHFFSHFFVYSNPFPYFCHRILQRVQDILIVHPGTKIFPEEFQTFEIEYRVFKGRSIYKTILK